MKLPITLITIALFLFGCDELQDEYFSNLLSLEKVDVRRVCSNNPSIFSDGNFIETYALSKSTFSLFQSKFNYLDTLDFPQKNGYAPISKYDEIVTWRRTGRDTHDVRTLLGCIDEMGSDLECFSSDDIKTLFKQECNYYTLFCNKLGKEFVSFQLVIMDSTSRRLLVLNIKYL